MGVAWTHAMIVEVVPRIRIGWLLLDGGEWKDEPAPAPVA